MTKAVVKVLEQQRKEILNNIQNLSGSPSAPDVMLRIEGVRLREINNVLEIIYDINKCLQKYPTGD